jgi:hypothetical protein
MTAGSGIRIGDAERNAAAESLREHYAAGRLTMEEFQERLDAVFAAKTDVDLGKLSEDLPHTASYAGTSYAGTSYAGSSYSLPWPPGPQASQQRGPLQAYSGYGRRQSPPGAGTWPGILASVAAIISFFTVLTLVIVALPFGGLPKTVLLVLAVFAFVRRLLRRVIGVGSSVGRRRGW